MTRVLVVEDDAAILRGLKDNLEAESYEVLTATDGEVGYQLRFFPETIELGSKIVEALVAEGIPAAMRGDNAGPDWHIYSYMYPVLLNASPTDVDCPFGCPVYKSRGGSVAYARGDCPVADDLFDRVVIISLNQWYSGQDCGHVADGINKVLSAYCTPDQAGRPWR